MQKQISKHWSIHSGDGKEFHFSPVFGVNDKPGDENGEVECQNIVMEFEGKKYTFNYLNLYMFFYYISNEELRQKLMQRYERKVFEIPYDVTLKLTKEERDAGVAIRRVILKVDEIAMAMVNSEAQFMRRKHPELSALFKGRK